jgi:hypothetical protein
MYAHKSTRSHKLGNARSMRSNSSGIRLCILGLLAWVLAGCQSLVQAPTPTLEASLMDRSLLTDKPCPAPCWYGLELGKSTRAEVLATLQTLSFADPKTIQEVGSGYWDYTTDKNLPATLIGIDCRRPNRQYPQCAALTVSNDILVDIGLSPNYALTLSEVVNHLGPPDYVGAVILQDLTTCKLMLMWVKKQIQMERTEPNGKNLCEAVRAGQRLDPSLTVDDIFYELPQFFDKIPLEGRDRPWPGFARP